MGGRAAASVTDDLDPARDVLAADVDGAQFADYHARMMLSSASAVGESSSAPARSHPVSYVVLERDRMIPPEAQEMVAVRADDVHHLPTSHTPMLSDQDGLAAVLSRLS